MPASERDFSDTLPDRRYLDTDFVASLLFDTQPFHVRLRLLLDRLLLHRRTVLVISSLVWTELAHALMRQSFHEGLPA